MRVAVCLGEASVAACVVNLLEVLHSANRHAGEVLFETRLVGDAVSPTFAGIRLEPEAQLKRLHSFDLVVVPAFRAPLDEEIDASASLLEALEAVAMKGRRLASACSGALLLAAAGVLDGRRATTHWRLAGLARERFPSVDWRQDSLVERDDLILTSGGGTAAIDLALELVSERGGEALSRTVAAGMLFDPHRGPQGRYFHIAHDAVAQDALVAQAQQKLVERLAAPPSVAELASDLNITARTLLRRFRAATGFTVQGYLQRVRMDAARDLLADGRVGVDAAMDAVGYEDRASFTRSFSRHFGMGPGAYRRAR